MTPWHQDSHVTLFKGHVLDCLRGLEAEWPSRRLV